MLKEKEISLSDLHVLTRHHQRRVIGSGGVFVRANWSEGEYHAIMS